MRHLVDMFLLIDATELEDDIENTRSDIEATQDAYHVLKLSFFTDLQAILEGGECLELFE